MQSEYEKFYLDLYGTIRKIPKNLEKNIDDVFNEIGKKFYKKHSKQYAQKAYDSVCYLHGFNGFPQKEMSEILELVNGQSNNKREIEPSNIYWYEERLCKEIYRSPYLSNIIHYGKKKADRWLDHPEEQKLKEMHIRDFFKEGIKGNPFLEFCELVKCCYITDLPYAIEQRRIELSKDKDFELTTLEALRNHKYIYPKLLSEILEQLNDAGIDIINHNIKSVDVTLKENPELLNKMVSISISLADKRKLTALADKSGMKANEYLKKMIKEEYERENK